MVIRQLVTSEADPTVQMIITTKLWGVICLKTQILKHLWRVFWAKNHFQNLIEIKRIDRILQ